MKRLKKFLARGKKRKQYIRICDNIVYLSDNGEFSNIEKYVNLLDRTNKMMRMLNENFTFLFSIETDKAFNQLAKAFVKFREGAIIVAIREHVNDVIETMRNAKYKETKMYCYDHFIRNGVFMDRKVINHITSAQIIEITNILNN